MMLILIQDDKDDDNYGVSWSEVVAIVCVCTNPAPEEDDPFPRWFHDVFPVLADGNAYDESPLRVNYLHDDLGGFADYAVVFADWPIDQDVENVRRIAKDLIANDLLDILGVSRVNWLDIPKSEFEDKANEEAV
jgi:hypothetical protein